MPDPEIPSADTSEQEEPQEPAQDPEEPDCSSSPVPTDCEPGIDDLACVAAGDKAKSAYNDTFASDLKTANTDYETTRTSYRSARHDVRLDVEDFRNQIRRLVERIGCKIEQKRVRKCLDHAFCDVLDELKCCPVKDPCCDKDCDFPLDGIDELSLKELTALITDYQARIEEAKQCFADLKKEPESLKARLDEVKKAVDRINAMLEVPEASLDLKKAYAEALVAQWKIGKVWGGFDKVQDFVDCLCQALTCWTKGCEAVYKLTGVRAVAECKDKAKQDRCDKLRNATVEQILAGYDRRCGKKDCEEPSDDNGGGKPHGKGDCKPDGDDEDDCGCHHHHQHHHHHDCGCHDDHEPKDRD